MHVLILNQTFHPDTAATAQLMWDLADHLDQAGHEVDVVTSRVFYGTDRLHDRGEEKMGQRVRVHRVSGTRFGKRSRLGIVARLSDFGSFYVAAAMKLWALPTPDVILALTSPPMIASLAVGFKLYCQALGKKAPRVVYHVMDLYPDAAEAAGTLRFAAPVARMTAWTVRHADGVIALGRDMKERLLLRYGAGVDAGRIHVVAPWADDRCLHALAKSANPLARELGLVDRFTLVYSGNFGLAHDADTFAQAIEQTRDAGDLCWLFIGAGKRFDELCTLAAERRWPHFRSLPPRGRDVLNESLNLADVHLVSQLPAFTGVVVPSKLFGIMAIARPTVFVGPADAECARILAEEDAGLVVRNGDVAGLLDAVSRLKGDPAMRDRIGRNARRALERQYSRAIAVARLEAILQAMLTGPA